MRKLSKVNGLTTIYRINFVIYRDAALRRRLAVAPRYCQNLRSGTSGRMLNGAIRHRRRRAIRERRQRLERDADGKAQFAFHRPVLTPCGEDSGEGPGACRRRGLVKPASVSQPAISSNENVLPACVLTAMLTAKINPLIGPRRSASTRTRRLRSCRPAPTRHGRAAAARESAPRPRYAGSGRASRCRADRQNPHREDRPQHR